MKISLNKYSNEKLYPGFSDLKKHFPFFIDQLVVDNELSSVLKHECLNKICSVPIKTVDELEGLCFGFFDSKKLIGTICTNSESNNSYVRIHGKDSLIGWISEIIGLTTAQVNSNVSTILYSSNSIISRGFMKKLLNNEALNDSYFQPQNCFKYFGLKNWKSRTKPTLKDAFLMNFNYIQWSFPNSKVEDLFLDKTTIDLVPCRAGLVVDGQKILFTHNLNDNYQVRKPTVFDARLYPQFQPGGTTKPLSSCSHLAGFDEFVHIPNNFANIDKFEAETFFVK